MLLSLAAVIFFFVVGGLHGYTLEKRETPNRGLRQCLRNALWGGLALGGSVGVLHGLWLGVDSGLAGFVGIGLIGAMHYGLASAIKYACLRLLLWASGSTPLDLLGLLEAASARALLRRVGGGYIFMHRQLIDYFASLPEAAAWRGKV